MEWFYSLPSHTQAIIIIIALLSVIIISLYGGVKIQKEKDKIIIKLGKQNELKCSPPKNRSCEDCFMILREKLITVDRKIKSLEEAKLSKSLNYMDQKMEELSSFLIDTYIKEMANKASDTDKTNGETIKQIRLFEGLLKDAIGRIKSELRRALRENGFTKINSSDFVCYIKSEFITIANILKDHFISVYPSNSSCMVINLDTVLSIIDNSLPILNKIVEDFFSTASEIISQIDIEINKIEEENLKWCYNFLKNKENSLSTL